MSPPGYNFYYVYALQLVFVYSKNLQLTLDIFNAWILFLQNVIYVIQITTFYVKFTFSPTFYKTLPGITHRRGKTQKQVLTNKGKGKIVKKVN